MPRQSLAQTRFGIGEWYGKSFADMPQVERTELALMQIRRRTSQPDRVCIPRSATGADVLCNKRGGVCSLRQYVSDNDGVRVSPGAAGSLRTTCPRRFEDSGKVFSWIGKTILGHSNPTIAVEVGFLEREQADGATDAGHDDVGRIDHVLMHPDADPLRWCALEVQAVYFSGVGMTSEFRSIAHQTSEGIPFPMAIRRPDYRSSGPKRLMPQLQIKVPSLRRWGKKMAVLVDADFFQALGKMDNVPDVSNCDIAWFVVRYEHSGGRYVLVPDKVQYTTLERAVEGLTAGRPVSLETFEGRLLAKVSAGAAVSTVHPPEISANE